MHNWWIKNLLKGVNRHSKNVLLDALYQFDKTGNNILEPYIREFNNIMASPELIRDLGNRIGINVYPDSMLDAPEVFIDKMLKVIINFGDLINVSEPTLPNGLPSIPMIINMSRKQFQETFNVFSEDAYQDRLLLVSELITL